ncbi:hypothetical protein CLU83_0788 [Flavobacterium sp. 1]|uniref:hypothetical protein n=1 Tax=Flavobacterium sp. 1 TaxID=2035200 RepID=UPI000CBBD44C|nr:hypothetical protein [Flavobacterium sp. 1]PJJ07602.1 hypothetical protein CLU83_0788 [Flavobacterium sp. 1]
MRKTVFLIAFLLTLTSTAFAQFFGGEKVTIYGIDFKANEVCGQKKFVGAPDYYRTPILNPLITKKNDDYYYSLGSYRRDKNTMETLDLFNLSLQDNNYPFLDTIDFDYYKSIGLARVEQKMPSLSTDSDYLKLKSYLKDSTHLPIAQRKKILFNSKNLYKNLILMSRYEIFSNEFTVDKKKVTKATTELKAQLDTITISTSAEISAKVRAYLNRLADESTNLKGYYVDARLDPAYIDKINYYINNTPRINIGNDQFAYNLKNYVLSNNAAANTSLVAIQLDGSFNKTRISIDSISADLSAQFQIPSADVKRIAASINFTFTRNETMTFKNKFNNLFIVRYFTSSIIDEVKFPEQKFTYNDGLEDGKRMGILVSELKKYYLTNNSFPNSLRDLNLNNVLSELGDTNLQYTLFSTGYIKLVFGGADLSLNTNDDKIYEGKNGKLVRIK